MEALRVGSIYLYLFLNDNSSGHIKIDYHNKMVVEIRGRKRFLMEKGDGCPIWRRICIGIGKIRSAKWIKDLEGYVKSG